VDRLFGTHYARAECPTGLAEAGEPAGVREWLDQPPRYPPRKRRNARI
jgi:hypothetical protein